MFDSSFSPTSLWIYIYMFFAWNWISLFISVEERYQFPGYVNSSVAHCFGISHFQEAKLQRISKKHQVPIAEGYHPLRPRSPAALQRAGDSQKTLTPCRLDGQHIAYSEWKVNPASGSDGPGTSDTRTAYNLGIQCGFIQQIILKDRKLRLCQQLTGVEEQVVFISKPSKETQYLHSNSTSQIQDNAETDDKLKLIISKVQI